MRPSATTQATTGIQIRTRTTIVIPSPVLCPGVRYFRTLQIGGR